MNRISWIFMVVIIVLLYFPGLGLAQNSAVYWSSFNMGFAVPISTTTEVTSVVGQTLSGKAEAGDTRIEGGFLAVALRSGYLVLVDTTAPVVTITHPERDSTYTTHITDLEYSLFDENPGDSIWYSVNGGQTRTSIPWGDPITGLQSEDGINKWLIYAKDAF